jgi:hypothetical protein
MNNEEFKKIMNRYFEGDASLNEELWLKQRFAEGNVPDEYLLFREYFSTMDLEAGAGMQGDPFKKVMDNDADTKAGIIPIRSRRKRVLRFAGIAASIILMIGVMFQLNRYINKAEDIYSDPEVAYNQAKNALLYVSSKLNRGTDKLKPIDKVNNGVNSLKQVAKFEEGIEQSQKIGKYNKIDNVIGISN